MTPSSFTFKLTLPRNPALGDIVADVAAHAVIYTEMEQAAGVEFVKRVAAAAATELAAAGPAHCPIVVTSADGELRLAIGGQTVTQKISA